MSALAEEESLKPVRSHFRLNHSGGEDSRDHESRKTDKADLFGRNHNDHSTAKKARA
jgi:hypothetical protein